MVVDYAGPAVLDCPAHDIHDEDCRPVRSALMGHYCKLGAPPAVTIKRLFWHPVDSRVQHFVEAFEVGLAAAAKLARGEAYAPPRWFTVECVDESD